MKELMKEPVLQAIPLGVACETRSYDFKEAVYQVGNPPELDCGTRELCT